MSPDALISIPMFGEGFIFNIPRFFTIFGFNIYYYGLFVAAGYALAGVYLVKRRKLFGLTKDNILDLILIALICGLVGARLYYMIFNFDRFFAPGQWGNIIRFRDGGLAVYGGIIASGIGYIVYSKVKKIPLGSLLDAAGFGLFVGQAIGRWGNFVNREAYGIETDLPWKMGLITRGGTTYVHPCFIYEALWNVAGLLIIHIFSKKSKTKYPGQYFLFYVAWYGLGRFMIEGLRTDSLMIPGTDIRASQWLAAISFLVAVGILFVNFLRGKEVSFDDNGLDIDDPDDDDDDADDDADDDDSDYEGAEDDDDTDVSGDVDDADDADAEDLESEEDMVELDGAAAEEIEEGGEFDVEAEDTESTEDLAELDGASEDEIAKESDENIEENKNENSEEDQ